MTPDEMINEHHRLLALSHDIVERNYRGRMNAADRRIYEATRRQIFALRGEMNNAGVEWREPQTEWSIKNYGMLII